MAINMSDEYVVLRCPQCGGEVQVDHAVFDEHYMETDGVAVYLGTLTQGEGATCTHCGTRFQKKQRLGITFSGTGELHVDTGGGAFIGGSVVTHGGDFVGRDKTTIAVVSGSGAVAQGPGAVAAGAGGIAIGGSARSCPRCYTINQRGATFCSNCGAKLK